MHTCRFSNNPAKSSFHAEHRNVNKHQVFNFPGFTRPDFRSSSHTKDNKGDGGHSEGVGTI